MNLLIDLLPNSVTVDDMEYEINSDFRTSMLFELLTQDSSIRDNDKIRMALELYYPNIPKNVNEAIKQIIWFYRCGKDVTSPKGKGSGKRTSRIYSFEYDDDYIYAAFMDQYNIDLQDIENLHWWKFKAMFLGLKENNKIVEIMGYRSMDLSKIKDKEQKAHYKKMQKIYEIPINQDEREKLDAIEKALLTGQDVSNLI